MNTESTADREFVHSRLIDSAEHKEQIAAVVQRANEQNLDRLQAEVARIKK